MPGSALLKAPLVGLVLVAFLILARHLVVKSRFNKADKVRTASATATGQPTPGKQTLSWKTPLALPGDASKWTFKESWASNLVAVGALLTTILASKEFVADELSGLSIGGFLAVNFFALLMALLAPIAFNAFADNGNSTYAGLLAAAFLTTWAVVTQIGTLAAMVYRGGYHIAIGVLVVAIPLGIVGIYVWRSIGDLVRVDVTTTEPDGTPTTELYSVPVMNRSTAIL